MNGELYFLNSNHLFFIFTFSHILQKILFKEVKLINIPVFFFIIRTFLFVVIFIPIYLVLKSIILKVYVCTHTLRVHDIIFGFVYDSDISVAMFFLSRTIRYENRFFAFSSMSFFAFLGF